MKFQYLESVKKYLIVFKNKTMDSNEAARLAQEPEISDIINHIRREASRGETKCSLGGFQVSDAQARKLKTLGYKVSRATHQECSGYYYMVYWGGAGIPNKSLWEKFNDAIVSYEEKYI